MGCLSVLQYGSCCGPPLLNVCFLCAAGIWVFHPSRKYVCKTYNLCAMYVVAAGGDVNRCCNICALLNHSLGNWIALTLVQR
jgi:hypothetical protein